MTQKASLRSKGDLSLDFTLNFGLPEGTDLSDVEPIELTRSEVLWSPHTITE